MPDLTPDVTTTPNFDPGRVAIASGWLVYDVGYHTCGGYGPESGYAHEPGCGAEPMCKVADIPDILAAAAERDALAAAWDEGHQAGHEDARAVQSTYPEPTPNPYRAEGEPHAGTALRDDAETCGTCRFRDPCGHRHAKSYPKCMHPNSPRTGGPKTDVRAWWPACTRWEALS